MFWHTFKAIQKPHGHHGMQVTVYLQITVELPEEIAKLPKQDFDEAVREKGRWDRMECSWFSITFFNWYKLRGYTALHFQTSLNCNVHFFL